MTKTNRIADPDPAFWMQPYPCHCCCSRVDLNVAVVVCFFPFRMSKYSMHTLNKHVQSAMALAARLRWSYGCSWLNNSPTKTQQQLRCFATKPFNLNKYDPREIAELLEFVEERLDLADREKFGYKARGRRPIHSLLRREAPSNVKRGNVNLKAATVELNTLLYTRHALKHGAKAIKELRNPKLMAQSFLGSDTNQKIDLRQGRTIILELWRHNRSPLLESFQKKHDAYIKRKKEVQRNIELKLEAQKKLAMEYAEKKDAALKAAHDSSTNETHSSDPSTSTLKKVKTDSLNARGGLD